MALPTIYVDTGGATTNSGSTDNNSATISSVSTGTTASATGTAVTISGAPDLSGIPTDGSATIYLNDATNSNQKIFKITGVDNGTKIITVSVAPTGVATSAWAVGGRFVWTSNTVESALAAGWTVQFNNSPASKSAAFLTMRNSGDSTSGAIYVKGKSGTRPVLQVSNTSNVIAGNTNFWRFENLEFAQAGASGDVISPTANASTLFNIKVSDGGGHAVASAWQGPIFACELTGVTGSGIVNNSSNGFFFGNYIHDNGSNGISCGSTSALITILYNIIDSNTGRGIIFSAATTSGIRTCPIWGNTVYGNGDSGLEITDADFMASLYNNIFSENGYTIGSGAYNVEWVAGTGELLSEHGYNVFYTQGTNSAGNLSNVTSNATEFTTDPLFTSASGGNFSISPSSPAKASGFPGLFLGGSTGYLDIGAVQRQESSGGGSHGLHAIQTGV